MERILNIQRFGSGNIGCGNFTNNHNITVNKTDDEDNQIKQWISPLRPQYRHQSVQASRVDGVGCWFLEMDEFREWSGSQGVPAPSVLFCYGDPGVGKTHISSLVIDWLCDQVHDREVVVAGLYCDYLAQEEQSAVNMLGAILRQLIERDGIPEPVRQAFREGKRRFGGRAVQLSNIVRMLKTTITSLPELFICIDGLDECPPRNRQGLLESLRDIVMASPATRVFLSGRPHIRDEIKRYFTAAIMIPLAPTIGDIERFLKRKLDQDIISHAMDGNLRAQIMNVIPTNIFPIFLLVSLNIDAVLKEVTISQRKKKLDQMIQGNGLQDAYSATLERIRAQEGGMSRLGMEALMWLSHSKRPLNANELCHALGVDLGSVDLDSQNIPAIETLLGCSLGLVTLEASSHTLRLVHYTLQEYLSNNPNLFHNPHSMIAQVCLTYLNFQCIRDLSPILPRFWQAPPLLEYASCYWGTHSREGINGSVDTLALRLLDGFDKHVSSAILLSSRVDNRDREINWSNPAGFTGLHYATYHEMVETVIALLDMKKWDLEETDVGGNTAFLWAARKGHGAIVKVLLEQEGVSPNTADNSGRTPLLWAVEGRFEGIVKMLLERGDLTPDIVDNNGQTPLLEAVGKGYGGIVKMLLEREDVVPNTADRGGRTPLSWAAGGGYGGIVKDLLGREDITPHSADVGGRTAFSWAAGNGNGDIVKMLLEREDVTLDTPDKGSRTPLLWAARNGYGGIVKIILEQGDITPDTPDKDGRTPFLWAAGNGNGDIVKMLLEQEDVTPDMADKDGRTPLLWAVEFRHEDVVKILLEKEGVTPNSADKKGQTPLGLAVRRGYKGIVKIILEHGDVTPNTPDKGGRTPLSWAAGNGSGGVVKTLLDHGDVTPDIPDTGGRTPLLWAARNGHGGIVKILLEREDVTPNTVDNGGRTPLSWAAGNWDAGIVKILLEEGDVTLDTPDKDGRTPLSWAAGNGNGGAVDILDWDDFAPDTADKDGRTPLSWAAQFQGQDVVKILLEEGDVALDTPDNYGRTPLSWAAGNGNERALETLLRWRDVALNNADKDERTPLSWATGTGNEAVHKILLEREDTTPDTADKDGRTPLSWAVERGHIGAAEILLQRARIIQDIVMTDPTGQTALKRTSSGALSQQLGYQGFVPQSVGSNGSRDLLPAEPFESSQPPFKKIRRS